MIKGNLLGFHTELMGEKHFKIYGQLLNSHG